MDEQKLNEKWRDLLFSVRRSSRYHTHRRKFFDKLGVWSDFLIIVSGGTVVGCVSSGEPDYKKWAIIFGAVTSVIGSFDLVIGFAGRARDHHDLCREFSQLEREMMSANEERTAENLAKFTNRRLEIEEEEPPLLHVLNAYCHNELVQAMGLSKEHRANVQWWQSIFKQWCDLFPHSLQPKK